jgi:hypothetical protein
MLRKLSKYSIRELGGRIMHVVIEKIIKTAYISLLGESYSPMVSNVLGRAKDIIDREALDMIYKELDLNITEEQVSEVLVNSRSAHTHFGEPMFDAQNILFDGWLEHLKLLKG